MTVGEVHGVMRAKRKKDGSYTKDCRVTVADDLGYIQLCIPYELGGEVAVGLSPEQARYLASKLYRLARLMEPRDVG